MRKPIIKFMAGTLAAAMVVTSPVTVFAGNDGFLSHIYSADSTSSDESEPDSHTKTGTNSVTLGNGEHVQVTWDKEWGTKSISNTGTLDDVKVPSKDLVVDDYVLGVEFDQDEINVIAGGEKKILKASVYTSNGKILSSDKLKGVLSFRKIQFAGEGQDLTSAKVGYHYDATAGGMGAIARDTLEIRGEHGGAFCIEARLDTNQDGEYEYTKRIPVFVKEYSADLEIEKPEELFLKNTYKLSAIRYGKDGKVSATANDTITWTAYIVDTSKNNKVGKATNYLTLKEDGTLVLKKDLDKINKDHEIWVQAVGEKGATAKLQINDVIKQAKPVTKLVDKGSEKPSAKKTIGWGRERNATADLDAFWDVTVVPDPADTTDQITWTSKNPQIATVTNVVKNDDGSISAKIVPFKVGKTTVTAQAASGKKVTYTVTVKAPLTSIDKVVKAGTNEKEAEIWVGQTIQLETVLNPIQSTDKVKYKATTLEINGTAVSGRDAKALVAVNNKGVVTTKVVKDSDKKVVGGKVRIEAIGKNVSENKEVTSGDNSFILTIKAPEITDTKLTVASAKSDALGTFKYPNNNNKSNANDSLYVGKDTTYTITGDKANKEGQDLVNLRNALSWTSNKSGIAAVNGGKTDALTSGKATVTASAVNTAGKKITAKVNVTSKQAVTALQLNKTEITINPTTNATKPVTTSVKVAKQLPAKCTKENIKWTIKGYNADGTEATNFSLKAGRVEGKEIGSDLKKTNVTIQAKDPKVGQYAIVTAEADHGAVATATVRVLEKTTSVKFITDPADLKSTVVRADLTIAPGAKFNHNLKDLVAVVTGSGRNQVAHRVFGETAEAGYESVTFTTNKNGIVTIDENGDVYGIKAGKVTITAKAPSGKSAKITITVK